MCFYFFFSKIIQFNKEEAAGMLHGTDKEDDRGRENDGDDQE
jgi:hypothetical protein